MKKGVKKSISYFITVLLLFGVIGGGLSAFAQTTKQIVITTNTDDNPFIRVFLNSSLYKTGGPFTIKAEMKIENFKKRKADANIFINIQDGREKGVAVTTLNTWAKNVDWFEIKTKEGEYITFDNIDKVLIDSTLQPYGLLNTGAIYCNATISYRNFRIYNAANKVVYSWDTDKDFQGLTNLKNIKSPEPVVFGLSFHDGSGTFTVSDVDLSGGTPTNTTTKKEGGIYEDETTTTKAVDTTKVASTTGTSSTSEVTTQEETQTTETSVETTELLDTAESTTANPTGSGSQDKPFNVWIPIAIIGGIIVLGGGAFVILLKLNMLPLKK
ncbi:MAG: hypothetical protein PHH84_01520 [Oscillospiraceae bacterium]|nr:hypothetical protein [Oscillospiraceae bacterium]MDD4545674.1 hypothetical protein [Oscillospiraceae bacterium]